MHSQSWRPTAALVLAVTAVLAVICLIDPSDYGTYSIKEEAPIKEVPLNKFQVLQARLATLNNKLEAKGLRPVVGILPKVLHAKEEDAAHRETPIQQTQEEATDKPMMDRKALLGRVSARLQQKLARDMSLEQAPRTTQAAAAHDLRAEVLQIQQSTLAKVSAAAAARKAQRAPRTMALIEEHEKATAGNKVSNLQAQLAALKVSMNAKLMQAEAKVTQLKAQKKKMQKATDPHKASSTLQETERHEVNAEATTFTRNAESYGTKHKKLKKKAPQAVATPQHPVPESKLGPRVVVASHFQPVKPSLWKENAVAAKKAAKKVQALRAQKAAAARKQEAAARKKKNVATRKKQVSVLNKTLFKPLSDPIPLKKEKEERQSMSKEQLETGPHFKKAATPTVAPAKREAPPSKAASSSAAAPAPAATSAAAPVVATAAAPGGGTPTMLRGIQTNDPKVRQFWDGLTHLKLKHDQDEATRAAHLAQQHAMQMKVKEREAHIVKAANMMRAQEARLVAEQRHLHESQLRLQAEAKKQDEELKRMRAKEATLVRLQATTAQKQKADDAKYASAQLEGKKKLQAALQAAVQRAVESSTAALNSVDSSLIQDGTWPNHAMPSPWDQHAAAPWKAKSRETNSTGKA